MLAEGCDLNLVALYAHLCGFVKTRKGVAKYDSRWQPISIVDLSESFEFLNLTAEVQMPLRDHVPDKSRVHLIWE